MMLIILDSKLMRMSCCMELEVWNDGQRMIFDSTSFSPMDSNFPLLELTLHQIDFHNQLQERLVSGWLFSFPLSV